MTRIKVRSVPRERDEEVLQMLAWRKAGKALSWIDRRLRVAPGLTAQDTGKVLKADLAESGEPEAVVRRGYWR